MINNRYECIILYVALYIELPRPQSALDRALDNTCSLCSRGGVGPTTDMFPQVL